MLRRGKARKIFDVFKRKPKPALLPPAEMIIEGRASQELTGSVVQAICSTPQVALKGLQVEASAERLRATAHVTATADVVKALRSRLEELAGDALSITLKLKDESKE